LSFFAIAKWCHELEKIGSNGGRRGHLVGREPRVLTELLGARPVQCANGQ
jgi:prolyl-tRNA editing enzyme YbaK/EbsC (Cys-tRNA(Pro) deacylase)